jgi:hypothetical protein
MDLLTFQYDSNFHQVPTNISGRTWSETIIQTISEMELGDSKISGTGPDTRSASA